jgi:uncharacterized protein (TIGR03435 family)
MLEDQVKHVLTGAVVGALATCFCVGQTTLVSPAFAVASVKPNRLDSRGFMGPIPGRGGFTGFKATNARLIVLVELAYNIVDRQLSGLPSWGQSEGFDIDAKAENPTTHEQINLMLQALLAERFKLKVRRETKEEAVYALVVEKDDPKLLPHPDDGTAPQVKPGDKPGEVVFQNIPVARLVRLLSEQTGRTVVNKTGLAGNYDFKLEWTSDLTKGPRDDNPLDASGTSIFAAVRKQLGLKLESQRGQSDYVVIEYVERPSAN